MASFCQTGVGWVTSFLQIIQPRSLAFHSNKNKTMNDTRSSQNHCATSQNLYQILCIFDNDISSFKFHYSKSLLHANFHFHSFCVEFISTLNKRLWLLEEVHSDFQDIIRPQVQETYTSITSRAGRAPKKCNLLIQFLLNYLRTWF